MSGKQHWISEQYLELSLTLEKDHEFNNIIILPNTEAKLIQLALKLINWKRKDEALIVCRKCIQDFPECGEGYIVTAQIFWEYRDEKRVVFLLKCALVCIVSNSKEPSISTEDLSDVLSLWPVSSEIDNTDIELSDTFSLLGERYNNLKYYSASTIFLRASCLLDKSNSYSHSRLAYALLEDDKLIEAIPVINAGLLLNPKDDKLLSYLGIVFKTFHYEHFSFLVFIKAASIQLKDESILLKKREPSEIDTMYELLKDDVLEKYSNPYFYFPILSLESSRKSFESVAYLLNANNLTYAINIVTTLSSIFETELKDVLFQYFKNEINATEGFNYDNLTMGTMLRLLHPHPENYITLKVKTNNHNNAILLTPLMNFYKCNKNQITEIANIIQTIIDIRNNITHGQMINEIELQQFTSFVKLAFILLTNLRVMKTTGIFSEIKFAVNNNSYPFKIKIEII
ncbi:MAG: hypothetical protein U0T31_00600 [Chitinophagales bacterium]